MVSQIRSVCEGGASPGAGPLGDRGSGPRCLGVAMGPYSTFWLVGPAGPRSPPEAGRLARGRIPDFGGPHFREAGPGMAISAWGWCNFYVATLGVGFRDKSTSWKTESH